MIAGITGYLQDYFAASRLQRPVTCADRKRTASLLCFIAKRLFEKWFQQRLNLFYIMTLLEKVGLLDVALTFASVKLRKTLLAIELNSQLTVLFKLSHTKICFKLLVYFFTIFVIIKAVFVFICGIK